MFTGLVEVMGTVVLLEPQGAGVDLVIAPPTFVIEPGDEIAIGDSIAINGCCLTVIDISSAGWRFQAGSETLSRTNLGTLHAGDRVNIERSLRVTARLGGHFVQGHVDDLGRVQRIEREGDWIFMWFGVPARLTRQMVSKGSVCVDGVSLTLVEVNADNFSVALIPHTLEVTTLGMRDVGSVVNIETDIIGKYIEKLTPVH